MSTLVIWVVLGLTSIVLILYLQYRNGLKTNANVESAIETLVEAAENTVVAQEATLMETQELRETLTDLAIIKDAPVLWKVHQLKNGSERPGIPNDIKLSLQKSNEARMLLHIPLFLQEMQKDGFKLVDDGRFEAFQSTLGFSFETEGERFVLIMEELKLSPEMIHATDYLEEQKTNLADWVEFEGHAEGYHLTAKDIILSVAADCDSECRVDVYKKIQRHVANSRVRVNYPQIANEFAMLRAVNRAGVTPVLERVSVKSNPVPDKIISLSYPEAVVNKVPMTLTVLFEKLVKLVAVGRFNAVVTGEAGWGKSQLAKYLARMLHAARVTTVISEDKCPIDITIDLIRQKVATESIFWIVEDAHRLSLEDLATLLNFMEGATTPANLSTMVLYNPKECDEARSKLLREALERPGRTTIKIETTLLEAEKAKELKEAIASLMPELAERTEWVAGAKSLAEVWSHFQPRVEKEIFG